MQKTRFTALLTITLIGLIVLSPIITIVAQVDHDTIDDEMDTIRDSLLPELEDWVDKIFGTTAFGLAFSGQLDGWLGSYGALETVDASLRRIKGELIAGLPALYNNTLATYIIKTGVATDQDNLFNGTAAVAGWITTIPSASGIAINSFSYVTQLTILYGNETAGASGILAGTAGLAAYDGFLPGYVLDTTFGPSNVTWDGVTVDDTGGKMANWMAAYVAANNTAANETMQANYGATWTQLTAVYDWLVNVIEVNILLIPAVDVNPSNAEDYFYAQWANQSLLWPDAVIGSAIGWYYGIELGNLQTLGSDYFWYPNGLWVPIPLNLSTCKALWNSSNVESFTNATGLAKWLTAWNSSSTAWGELNVTFGLSDTEMGAITKWLFWWDSYGLSINKGTPDALSGGTSQALGIYKQDPVWGDLYDGTSIYDFVKSYVLSDFSDMNVYGTDEASRAAWLAGWVDYFVMPDAKIYNWNQDNATGLKIPYKTMSDLFSFNNQSGFANLYGAIDYWIPATAGDATAKTYLMSTFNLTANQLGNITAWLDKLVDDEHHRIISETYLGWYSTDQLSIEQFSLSFYWQLWSSGNIYPWIFNWDVTAQFESTEIPLDELGLTTVIPDAFFLNLSVEDAIDHGIAKNIFASIGYPSLTKADGLVKWHDAVCNGDESEYYTELQGAFSSTINLTDTQMEAILNWIPVFEEYLEISTNYCDTAAPPPVIPGFDIFVTMGVAIIAVVVIIAKKKQR